MGPATRVDLPRCSSQIQINTEKYCSVHMWQKSNVRKYFTRETDSMATGWTRKSENTFLRECATESKACRNKRNFAALSEGPAVLRDTNGHVEETRENASLWGNLQNYLTIQVKTMTLKHFPVTYDWIKLSSLALATWSLFKCGPLPRSCVSSWQDSEFQKYFASSSD